MKIKFLIYLILLSITCIGQTKYNYKQGYKFILKAERNLNRGNLIKAEKFIEKAKKSNYGFCGNAWASAFGQIKLIEAQILNKQNKFDKALTVLDSLKGCSFGADCNARDSLKIVTLILKFGKEKVKETFKNVNDINVQENNIIKSYSLNLIELNYIFRFECDDYYYVYDNGKRRVENKTKENILNEVKNKNYFKLLE